MRALLGIIPMLITAAGTALVGFAGAVGVAGGALEAFGIEMAAFIAGLSTLETFGLTAIVAGLGLLTYWMLTAQTGTQRFAASLQQAADKANNLHVLGVLAQNMQKMATESNGVAGKLANVTTQMHANAAAGRYLVGIQGDLNTEVAQSHTAMASQAQQFMTVTAHARALAQTYHTSFVGALALADQAGVKLNQTMTKQAWAIAQIKIQSLVAGTRRWVSRSARSAPT